MGNLYKRRYVTLIEMMIVMFLIALIAGVLAYNYRGTLEEGKAFKTQAGIEKLQTILNLEAAERPGLMDDIESKWKDAVKKSPLVQNANTLIKDGWGNEYTVTVEGGKITVKSDKYDEYKKTTPTMFGDEGR